MSGVDLKSIAVMLVDDEPFVRQVTGMLLTKMGCPTPLEASNGQEALSQLTGGQASVDVIFCDLMMPDMDGVELVRHLSELEDPPAVVLLSGAKDTILRATVGLALARRLHVLGFVKKPVSRPDVEAVLNNLSEDFRPLSRRQIPKITEQELSRGIQHRELLLHYQPKVDVRTKQLNSVEALVRWKHPNHGLVFPEAFIELAESSPLITPMTEMLVELAVQQVAEWKDQGVQTHIGVNLSPSMIHDVSLPERLYQLTADHGLAPENVVLEVTETGYVKDEAIYLEILTRLHMRGFPLSIDDFGTGSSSLEKLAALPFSELKVDRAFVDGASKDDTKRAILEGSLGLAKSLKLKAVAEGVETQADWDLLASLGCDVVQGYFVAKPMPADQLLPWVNALNEGDII